MRSVSLGPKVDLSSHRFILNYKNIPYRTIWLSYPDIKPTQQALGVPPTAVSRKDPRKEWYTLPMISDPHDPPIVVVDSPVIAEYLELAYPSNPIFPPGSKALQGMFQTWTTKNLFPLVGPLVVSGVPTILDPDGAEYFRRTREVSFDKPSVEEICPKGEARFRVWEQLKKEFDALDGQMARNDRGKWVMGEQVSYADMILTALFVWMRSAPSGATRDGEEFETVWDVMKEWNGGRWKVMLAAMEMWMIQK